MSPFPPIGNTDINANVRNKSLCGVKVVLLGLTSSWDIQILAFDLFSIFCMASMVGNSLILLILASDLHLHPPGTFCWYINRLK